jgi:ABC-type branched-subunit amino acid transport system ATPase component/nitrate/nitrite transporter NarK
MSRHEEPKPIEGAQVDSGTVEDDTQEVPAVNAPVPEDTSHEPPADAPTELVDAHIPGTTAARDEKPDGPLWLQPFKLIRQGLKISNLQSSYGRTPLVMLMALGIVSIFGARAFSQALPEIQRSFKLNLSAILELAKWVGLMGTLLSVPLGYLGDRTRRVTLFAIGSMVNSLGVLFTGLTPNRFGLYGARSIDTIGELGPNAVGFSLIADYVPPEARGQSYAFRAAGRQIGAVIAPLFVGIIGSAFGWRVPFIIVGIAGVLLSLYFFRMPEPIRGYHERKAFGANEEIARRQQEAPSWGEAFRAAWGVRTLRRYSYAIPFAQMSTLGFAIFMPLYLATTHQVDLFMRGVIGSLSAATAFLGVAMGGPLVDRIVGRNPGRVVMISGVAGAITALGYVGIALGPNVPFVMAIILITTFFDAMILPATVAVTSMVIPPRLRNLGIATLDYWTIPVFFMFPVIGAIAGAGGMRSAILTFVPFSFIGSLLVITAGPYVEFDMRSAAAAALAEETWREAKLAGKGKLLVLRGVDVHYDSVQVLFGVDLDVAEGEIIALLGTNGAGKSTVLRAISGTQEASGGAIVFDGKDITHVPPHEIAGEGIAQTPGGRGVFPSLTVKENLELAGWLYSDDPNYAAEVEQVFSYFPVLRQKLNQAAGSMSGGEQQMLTLAQAFLSRPKLLMIDELSLGLAPAIVEQLLKIVRAIHQRGTTIILVEQSVNVALTVAQRAVFMEKGEIRFDGPTDELLGRPDIMRAVFLKGGKSLGATAAPTPALRDEERANILEVEGLVKTYGGVRAVDGVSFALRENEALGLIGPNGAGKTTVLEMISGFNPIDEGRIMLLGKDVSGYSPEQRASLGLVRRFQDAKLFPSLTVFETVALSFERHLEVKSMIVHGLGLPQARRSEATTRRKADALIELLELGGYRDKFVSELSTGTRRILDLACVLAAEPRVLLLDEPSSGLAQREAENMGPLLNQIKRETGCSLIIIEHDMPLISAVSDELIAMVLGKVVIRDRPDVVLSDERVVQAYLGGDEAVIKRSGSVTKKDKE